ncbi:zinc ABC transporter substrate-binding protein [Pseudorhodobacter sp.]|uniref:zinc ABC transporter substrate-binding protein n=1 Tax=Pseudorhodobacter sp. TaxID=1934400 RepID=UPI0039E5DC7C
MCRFFTALLVLAWGQAALADAPKVVVDIAPVQALVAMVMGDTGAPGLLLPQGADAHDFQLRPSQARDLAAADLVIWVGPEMTPWLGRALMGGGNGATVALLDAPQVVRRGFEGENAAAGHDHASHDHLHEGLDPHAWLEPANAQIWLRVIADALAIADPTQAAVYQANADAAQAQIATIEAEIAAILAPVKGRPFAVTHDAYGYFADHFGLQIVGSLRTGDAAMPGAAHLTGLQTALLAEGAVCIFPEANHDDSSARQMAEAAGLHLGGALDPEGSSLTPGPALYGDLMLGLATVLAACLSRP